MAVLELAYQDLEMHLHALDTVIVVKQLQGEGYLVQPEWGLYENLTEHVFVRLFGEGVVQEVKEGTFFIPAELTRTGVTRLRQYIKTHALVCEYYCDCPDVKVSPKGVQLDFSNMSYYLHGIFEGLKGLAEVWRGNNKQGGTKHVSTVHVG